MDTQLILIAAYNISCTRFNKNNPIIRFEQYNNRRENKIILYYMSSARTEVNSYKNIYIAPFARGVYAAAAADPPLTVASPSASYIARSRCCSCCRCCCYYDYCHRRRVLYTILLYYIHDIYRRGKKTRPRPIFH